ncbi:MAG: YbaK/EbsC family protein [Gammaproteobacteria bacterium]|nr:YbaK/EbsC family protein [Gammaproteobacteria bacterium]
MSMAETLTKYLHTQDVPYDLLHHPHTATSMQAAQAAHVPGDWVAKTVLLEDDDGYVMAVLPATHRIDLGELHRQMHRRLGLATEAELTSLFMDCEVGAVPPIGRVYGIDTIVDDSLAEQAEVYFDAGDHEQLVHVSGEVFGTLLGDVEYAHFSHRA